MPKQYTAQSIETLNQVQFETKGDIVTGLIVTCNVNYGEMGLTHQIDLWKDLPAAQRQKAQALYDAIKAKVENIILG